MAHIVEQNIVYTFPLIPQIILTAIPGNEVATLWCDIRIKSEDSSYTNAV